MTCPPQAGVVPKYGQQLSAQVGIWAAGGNKGRGCKGTGLFGFFSLETL